MPPCRSSPRLMGTRRTVVSFMRPVAASRIRWTELLGLSAKTLPTTSAPVTSRRERIVRKSMACLPVEDGARRDRVASELLHQRLARWKRLHVAQPAYPLDGHRFAVQLAGEVEQIDLQGARRDAEGGPRPLVHHAPVSHPASPFPLPRQSYPDCIHPVRRQELAGIGRGEVDRRNPDRPPPPCPALHDARRAVAPAEPALGGREVPVRDRGAGRR